MAGFDPLGDRPEFVPVFFLALMDWLDVKSGVMQLIYPQLSLETQHLASGGQVYNEGTS